MSIDKITDHKGDAKDRLLEQYKDLPNIEGILDALVSQIQNLEDAYEQLCVDRFLENASGLQLDNIGTIVGQAREIGQSDADYLVRIKTRIIQNISQGQAESVITVYKTLIGASLVLLVEAHPAALFLQADIDLTDQDQINSLYEEIKTVMSAGVRLEGLVGFDDFSDTFAFDGTLPGKGFSSTGAPTTGGKLPKLYKNKNNEFAFAGTDPSAGGFSSTEDPLVGGFFSQ